jgi:hypothetical protein
METGVPSAVINSYAKTNHAHNAMKNHSLHMKNHFIGVAKMRKTQEMYLNNQIINMNLNVMIAIMHSNQL